MWKLSVTLCTVKDGDMMDVFSVFVGKTAEEVNAQASAWIMEILRSGYIIHRQTSDIVNMNNGKH